jgi:hypothetical protein
MEEKDVESTKQTLRISRVVLVEFVFAREKNPVW